MTVEFVPARPHLRSVPRKRLSLPGFLLLSATAAWLACATSACSDRGDDTRVALTTSAARELAQTQPTSALTATSTQQDAAPLAGAFSSPSNSPDSANGSAIAAQAIRSPAHAAVAPENASGADSFSSTGGAHVASDAPLAPPEIHTAD